MITKYIFNKILVIYTLIYFPLFLELPALTHVYTEALEEENIKGNSNSKCFENGKNKKLPMCKG